MKPYDYQDTGADFIVEHERSYLADEMGLGKTVQALLALLRSGIRKATVICPAAAKGNWEREAGIWHPDLRLHTASYASLQYHQLESPALIGDAVILDEAHYVKSKNAKRTKNALALAKRVPRSILLSGTPMPNHPGELWTVFNALWPELLGDDTRTYMKWFNHFCKWRQTQYGPKVYGFKNAKSFEAMLAADPDARSILKALQTEQVKQDPSTSRVRRLIGEYKAPHVAEKLAVELEEQQYEKIVVLYHHTTVGDTLQRALDQFGVVRLDGKTPATQRQNRVDQFTNDGDTRVFIGQQTAAGEALNLQAASELALVEPAWTPDANRQAIKRIHRIGQDAPCRARVFAVAKTLDESVMSALAQKTNIQEGVGLR
jgi:SNF2 family DNA or RNA helicase